MLSYVGDQRSPLDAIRALLNGTDDILAAVAYVKLPAVKLLGKELRALHCRGGQLNLLTGFDFGTTQRQALDELQHFGAQVRIHSGTTFHPKTWLGTRNNRTQVLIGSANLTSGALLRNVESGVSLGGTPAKTIYPAAYTHLHQLWNAATPYGPAAVIPIAAAQTLSPVQQQIMALFAQQKTVRTATGAINHLLRVSAIQGVLVGTARSPRGQWVPWWMLDVVVDWLNQHLHLRLNTSRSSGIPDCTRYLRVHRSSAVFAILGALPGYQLHAKPARLQISRR